MGGLLGVGAFTAAYIVGALGWALSQGNREFLFYIVVMFVLIGVVASVHLRAKLTVGGLWALSIWGLLHMAGGLVPVPESWPINGSIRVLYSLWLIPDRLKYDQVVHAYGFAVTTWVCWQGLSAAVAAFAGKRPAPSFGLLVLCAAGGMGFGAANEIVEFIATLLLPQTNVGGYVNTGWDLVSNAVGAIFAALLIRASHDRNAG